MNIRPPPPPNYRSAGASPRKRILRLVQQQSLVAKCCKIREIDIVLQSFIYIFVLRGEKVTIFAAI